MKTIKEMVEVMQAFEQGRAIECQPLTWDTWADCKEPGWNWQLYDYRVKPTRITEGWLVQWEERGHHHLFHANRHEAELSEIRARSRFGNAGCVQTVHLIEATK
jgi:hypothetical protein